MSESLPFHPLLMLDKPVKFFTDAVVHVSGISIFCRLLASFRFRSVDDSGSYCRAVSVES